MMMTDHINDNADYHNDLIDDDDDDDDDENDDNENDDNDDKVLVLVMVLLIHIFCSSVLKFVQILFPVIYGHGHIII